MSPTITEAKKILVVTSPGLVPEWAEQMQSLRPDAEFVFSKDNIESVLEAAPGINAMVNCPRLLFTAEVLRQAGNSLEWIHLGGAGCEEYLIPELVNSEITFTNGKIIQGPEVADHAMALYLCLARNLNLVMRGYAYNEMPRPIELRKKTAVIIGVGGIGMLIAERANAFGMTVIGIDQEFVPMTSTLDRLCPQEELLDVLPQADVVFMSAPRTDNTYQMMNNDSFSAMQPHAVYVSVSRGTTTDTDALTKALKSKTIRAAGIDVSDPEPLAQDHPLRSMDNVVISPHIAGLSDFNRQRSFDLIKTNIGRYLDNKQLINTVDKARGY
jgi:phosphoglycerate dehydrogenase-like enzyme